ncbi:MAG: ABC transporter ATP-binding protein [Mycobacteriales bacterium]
MTSTSDAPAGTAAGAGPVADRLITGKEVTKRFKRGHKVLDAVDITVDTGEFVAIVGPSGCGKSTLLRLVSGLDKPSGGILTMSARQIGYVFQDPALLPWRSTIKNVELPGELHGLSGSERRARAEEALALVGLEAAASKLPRQLSGGMRMRAALARELTMRPDLFLFDEPFSAVDELTRGRLGSELEQIFLDQQFGALFVTHSVSEAVRRASRVLVMSRHGKVVEEIPVPLPYPRPPFTRVDAACAKVEEQVFRVLERELELT